VIELRDVTVRFGAVTALNAFSLAVQPARTTVLIGSSGCGKSTVLRLAVGLVAPDSGEVLFDGRRISPETVLSARRRMGYVIQDGGLFPHLTAEQNVLLMARHLGNPDSDSRKRLMELCDLTHFPTDGLSRYPTELSGGQRQRVALMRGLMLDPDVLLLDEPLGALDPMVRASLQTDLKRIFAELGKTVLFVTHDMGEAGYLGDAIVLIKEGSIVQVGSLEDLRERPVEPFVTEFMSAQRSLVAL